MNLQLFKNLTVTAPSYEEASGFFQAYIAVKNYGASKLPFAILYNDQRQPIAHVSYNGRVWAGADVASMNKTEITLNTESVTQFFNHYLNIL